MDKLVLKRKKKIVKKNPLMKLNTDMCLRRRIYIDPNTHKKKVKYCKNKILSSTGRCGFHSRDIKKSQKTGKYKRFFKNNDLKKVYQSFVTDPDLFNLRDEIALLRTMLIEIRENKDGKLRSHIYQEKTIISAIKELGNLVEKLYKIENNHFSIEAIPLVINQITLALNETIHNCPKCGHNLTKLAHIVYDRLDDLSIPGDGWLQGAQKDRQAALNRIKRKNQKLLKSGGNGNGK